MIDLGQLKMLIFGDGVSMDFFCLLHYRVWAVNP
jgi:hypothetical protein